MPEISRISFIYLLLLSLLVIFLNVSSFADEPPPDPLAGKTVRKITIEMRPIFEGQELSKLTEYGNSLKFPTKNHVILQELLFKEGDKINQFVINDSLRNLRATKYLRKPYITPTIDGEFVDLLVSVQDTWTLIPQLSVSGGDGRDKLSIGLEESNVLGYGKRLEVLYREDDQRDSIEGVWDDRRVWGTKKELLLGAFSRSDGERFLARFGRPFRGLSEKQSWSVGFDAADTVGRLFRNGDERFLFRQDKAQFDLNYTVARGDYNTELRRFGFGYRHTTATFNEARLDDIDDQGIDPTTLDQDPSQLAEDRKYGGPVLSYQYIVPKFVPLNYIDRFERVEDYNLGDVFSISFNFAPEVLGSIEDAVLFSTNRSMGHQFNDAEFIRGELGFASRAEKDGLNNSLFRGELKYYNVIGQYSLAGVDLGLHTFAAALQFDYGNDLDRDREFLIGGDNSLRGYDARTFVGDKRITLNVEERTHIVDDLFDLFSVGAAAFADLGGATDESLGNLFDDHIYSDIGIGIRLGFPRFSGANVVRIDLAFPLRAGPDGSDEFEPRLVLSGGQLFSSFLRSERVGAERATVAVGFDR